MVTGKLSDAEYEARLLSTVQQYGCHVTSVFDPDGDEPGFTYSTGFTRTVGQGEVIVFGLASNLMASMVNETLLQCRDGLRLDDGLRLSGLLDGFDVVARRIPPANIGREHFNSAMWFHQHEFGTELNEAYQLVWPGAQQGLFPWEESCDPYVLDMQPPLYEKGTVH